MSHVRGPNQYTLRLVQGSCVLFSRSLGVGLRQSDILPKKERGASFSARTTTAKRNMGRGCGAENAKALCKIGILTWRFEAYTLLPAEGADLNRKIIKAQEQGVW